jgi:hypothetical protein
MIKTIYNSVSKSNFKLLQDSVNSDNFNWYYLQDSAFGNETDDKRNFNYSFYHVIFYNDKINSNYYDLFNSCALEIKDKLKLDEYKIFRLRLGLTTAYGKPIIHNPHIDDQDRKHKVILLYLDNSDGDTCFYENKKIIKSITPEENKAVLFDGSIYHSSSKPFKNSKRIVLNINLEKI